MKKILLISMMLFLTACSSVSSKPPTEFPEGAKKEVYIQPGTLRVLGPIKDVFKQNGWKVDEINKDEQRFFVHLNTKKVQLFCWNENSEMEVELLMMDKESGSSVFSILAQTCDSYTNLKDELNKVLLNLD
jgi:hypothetical protein